jgi:hypothetical protein
MERSTCVVCGRKREHKYLKKMFKVWVCDNEIHYQSQNHIKKIDGTCTTIYSECRIKYFELKMIQISKQLNQFENEFKNFPSNYIFPGQNSQVRKDVFTAVELSLYVDEKSLEKSNQ